MAADDDLKPWFDALVEETGELDLLDVHTHTGQNDPDGFSCTPERLLGSLDAVGARAVVFTMHEPDGYPAANDRILREAEAAGGQLIPFCRVDPRADGAREAERCLDAGARGIKLHPRAERFALADPEAQAVLAVAAERGVPVLTHAGRGIPALGRHALAACEEHPALRLILAHCAITDLSWIWREMPDHPNLFIDTSWWSPDDLLALFTLVPPGQILWASDMPYGSPMLTSILSLRPALEAGLTLEQLRGVAGEQADRLLSGEELLDLGPAPGPRDVVMDPLIERVHAALLVVVTRMIRGLDASEQIDLARMACAVPDGCMHEEVFRAVSAMLDEIPRTEDLPNGFAPGIHLAITALVATRTPSIAVPAEPVGVTPRA